MDDGLRLTLDQVHLVVGSTLVALAIWRLVLHVRQRVEAPAGLAPWTGGRREPVRRPAGEATP